jgi:NTE family protein
VTLTMLLRRCLTASLVLALTACAIRPVNPALQTIDLSKGYRSSTQAQSKQLKDTEILLTFSGGGTRAAAFAFGVLEELRRQTAEVHGLQIRLLDEVAFISGVSGGSFTALAYGLYGTKLFDDYPERFLKRDVQGELLKRTLNPANWGKLSSRGIGRSEIAAEYYDEILFGGATFGDLTNKPGPLVMAGSTDISTGARLAFTQRDFDIICADLAGIRLSRAAAASSAVPIVLSPVTINNYGGKCGYRYPPWAMRAEGSSGAAQSGRLHQRQLEMRSFENSADRPYLHLVDGGVADNLGLRAVLERFRAAEVSPEFRRQLGIQDLKRTLLIVVNSRSEPATHWDRSEDGPSAIELLLQSVSVPIDRNSFETLELMKDMLSRWKETAEVERGQAKTDDQSGPPRIRLYPAVVSFDEVKDETMRKRLMALPTSFALAADDVDLLRNVAGKILRESQEFAAFLEDIRSR